MSDPNIERKKPFSSLEKELFISIIQKYEDILSCKKTNAISALKKKHSWEKIRNEFNSSPIVSQNTATKQLIKLWYNMKAKAREAKTKENVRFLTGGGPSVNDMNVIDCKVMDIDKNILTNVQVDIDSDINGSVVILGDENDNAWSKNNGYSEIPDMTDESYRECTQTNYPAQQESTSVQKESREKNEEKEYIQTRTPMKKSSFGEKYIINKIDLLKIKILEEELRHNQEIHKEELILKRKEREYKEKMWEIELKIKEKHLKQFE